MVISSPINRIISPTSRGLASWAIKSCSKISSPWKPAAAIASSFSSKLPEIETVAIEVFMSNPHGCRCSGYVAIYQSCDDVLGFEAQMYNGETAGKDMGACRWCQILLMGASITLSFDIQSRCIDRAVCGSGLTALRAEERIWHCGLCPCR